jgi:hypothetical protein
VVITESVQRAFGVEPSTEAELPVLGNAVLPPQLRSESGRVRHRSLGARWHAIRSKTPVRFAAVLALIAAAVVFFPSIVNLWKSVASEGAARISDVVDERSLGDGPLPVGYTLTCPSAGAGWAVEWLWPGDLPPDVAGYGIRTRTDDGPALVHTVLPWSDPAVAPPSIRLSDPASTTVLTDHRGPDGRTIATTSEPMHTPTGTC